MVRKFSIDIMHDGKASVTSEIGVIYETHEQGIRVLMGLLNTIMAELVPKPEMAVPLTPDIEKRIASIIAKHKDSEKGDNVVIGRDVKKESEQRRRENQDPFPPITKKRGPKSAKKPNKYGIPPELRKTDKKRYDVLWQRCKSHKITYEEALKRDGIKGGRTPKSVIVPPSEPDFKIEGADAVVDKMPEIRPPTREAHKRVHAAVTAANINHPIPDEFKIGVHVKQVKPYNARKVSGIGVVTNFVKGLIEVNFNGTQYYKIAPDCLEVV